MIHAPLFTLTTDFGTRDGYVGAMKGCILQRIPKARIVDISHEIPAQDVRAASWCIARAAAQFPAGTIHIVVVDPGVGSARPALMGQHQGQWFVGPDNGVFTQTWRSGMPEPLIRLHRETTWWRAHQSFDGLALFAPAACCVAEGHNPDELGVRQIQYMKVEPPGARFQQGTLYGEVLLFDRFGNAITNVGLEDLRPFAERPFSIRCAGHHFAMADHYADGGGTQPIAIINSDNRLELCCFGGSAQAQLQLRRGELVLIQPAPGSG